MRLLSCLVAVSASVNVIQSAYDIPLLYAYVDWFSVMAYSYRGHWNQATGSASALYSADEDNIDVTMQYWLLSGVPRDKLMLGVATHGHGWTLANPALNGIAAPAEGPSTPLPYTNEAGLAAYFELENMLSSLVCWTAGTEERVSKCKRKSEAPID